MKKSTIVIISLFLMLSLVGCGKKNSKVEKTGDTKISSVAKEKEASEEDLTTSNFDKENVDQLIKNSDYISRIRVSTSTAEGTNTSFLKDYKGDLSQIEVSIPKTLSPNMEYIVFYKDDERGEVSPTERDGSFIEIQGDKDSNLIYIEKVFNSNSYSTTEKVSKESWGNYEKK